MASDSGSASAESWGTGAALIVGSAVGGALVVFAMAALLGAGSPTRMAPVNAVAFVAGAVVTFVALSYLLYGR